MNRNERRGKKGKACAPFPLCSSKGIVTVEAALLYPIIFLAVLYLFIAGIVYYQKCCFQSAVGRATACISLNVTKPANGDSKVQNSTFPYITNKTFSEQLNVEMTEIIAERLKDAAVFTYPEQTILVETKIANQVLHREVTIRVTAGCRVPFAALFGKTNEAGLLLFQEETTAVMHDPVSLTRNIVMIEDFMNRLEAKDYVDGVLRALLDPLKKILEKYRIYGTG